MSGKLVPNGPKKSQVLVKLMLNTCLPLAKNHVLNIWTGPNSHMIMITNGTLPLPGMNSVQQKEKIVNV